MKIKETFEDYEDGMGSCLEIYIDDKLEFCVHDGEPEDNTLCRNFNDCNKVLDLLKRAYEAGKRGETLEIE